jgi:hypothetical protein
MHCASPIHLRRNSRGRTPTEVEIEVEVEIEISRVSVRLGPAPLEAVPELAAPLAWRLALGRLALPLLLLLRRRRLIS